MDSIDDQSNFHFHFMFQLLWNWWHVFQTLIEMLILKTVHSGKEILKKRVISFRSSSFWLYGVESRDFFSCWVRKNCFQSWANSQNDNYFVNSLSFENSSFFLSMKKITWLNSQQPKTRGHVEHLIISVGKILTGNCNRCLWIAIPYSTHRRHRLAQYNLLEIVSYCNDYRTFHLLPLNWDLLQELT